MSLVNMPVKFGKGHIENTLLKLGENDTSNYAYFGYDSVNNTGAVIVDGRLVSSKIIDIKLYDSTDENAVDGSQTISVVYIDAHAKTTATMSFDVINLSGVENILQKYDKLIDDISNNIKNVSTYTHKNINSIQQNINDIYQQVANIQINENATSDDIDNINSSINDLIDKINNINTGGSSSGTGGSVDLSGINASILDLYDLINNNINSSINIINSSIDDLYTKIGTSGGASLYWIDSDY